MSSQPTPATATPPAETIPAGEAPLGRALTLIHRVLPRLDELDRADAVQDALRQAAAQIEAARVAHEQWSAPLRSAAIDRETLALIAAAVSVVLGRPYRVVDIQKTSVAVAWVNAWAMEGRSQHYSSHKVR